jgi:hypothetical protein
VRAPAEPQPGWDPVLVGPVPHYQDGQWSTGDAWIDRSWAEPRPWHPAKGCAVRGYYPAPVARLGIESGLKIYLWARDEDVGDDVPPCLLLVTDGNQPAYLSAGSLPDALDLMGRWAPVVTAAILTRVYDNLAGDDESKYGILTSTLALARANEDAIESERRAIGGYRAEEADYREYLEKHPERQRRQQQPWAGPQEPPPWAVGGES